MDQGNLIPALGIAAALIAVLVIVCQGRKNSTSKEIPMPKGRYPLIGHLFALGSFPSHKCTEWHRQLGPIIQLQMGVKRWIVISDPELAHEIFVNNGAHASSRPQDSFSHDHYAKGGRGIIFSTASKNWRNARIAALKVLGPGKVDRFSHVIESESDLLVESLIRTTREQGSVNPVQLLQLSAVNVILSTCFGTRAQSIDDPLFQDLVQVMVKTLNDVAVDQELGLFLPALSIFSNIRQKIDFALNRRDPLLKQLLKIGSNNKDCLVSKLESLRTDANDILVIMSDLLLAGTDTTSITLSWIFAILVNYPETQQDMQTELSQFMDKQGQLPSFKHREQLPFLISVIKECMRFKPLSHFGLPHIVEQDIQCRGYVIPKGAAVLSNMHAMHLDPRVYDDPETFKPDRFHGNSATMMASAYGKLKGRDHFNFGWGRRLCPGTYLAEFEIFTVLVRLLSQCKVETQGNEYPDLNSQTNAGVVITPAPYKVRFVPIN